MTKSWWTQWGLLQRSLLVLILFVLLTLEFDCWFRVSIFKKISSLLLKWKQTTILKLKAWRAKKTSLSSSFEFRVEWKSSFKIYFRTSQRFKVICLICDFLCWLAFIDFVFIFYRLNPIFNKYDNFKTGISPFLLNSKISKKLASRWTQFRLLRKSL